MNKQKVFYDSKADALWILLKEGPEEEHREVAPNISVELDEKGELAGTFKLTGSEGRKGAWLPGSSGQLRLDQKDAA